MEYFSKELIEGVALKKDPSEILLLMKNNLRDIAQNKTFETLEHKDEFVYRKKVLEEKETNLGKMQLCYLRFFKDKFTGLHTHPEFVSEYVLSGQMIEQCYEEIDQKLTFKNEQIHESGHLIDKYCCKGSPHRVTSKTESCEVLIFTLGHNSVEYIDG